MNEIWKFSPSSLPLLEQCMELAAQDNRNNRWQLLFHPKPYNQESSIEMETEPIVSEIICLEDTPNIIENVEEHLNTEDEGNIMEIIENNQIDNLEFIIQELDKKPHIFRVINEKLNINVIEKLSSAVMSKENLPNSFIKYFIEYVLPKLIKETTQHLCIEIITKLYKYHCENLKNSLVILLISLRDSNMSIFHDFTQSLESREKSQLIIALSNLNLNSEDFSYVVPSLVLLLRDCECKNIVLSEVLSLLYKFREELSSNKDFGRLVLTFLQTIHTILSETDMNISSMSLNINFINLEVVIESNKTPFRKPCQTLLQKIQAFSE